MPKWQIFAKSCHTAFGSLPKAGEFLQHQFFLNNFLHFLASITWSNPFVVRYKMLAYIHILGILPYTKGITLLQSKARLLIFHKCYPPHHYDSVVCKSTDLGFCRFQITVS